MNRRGELWPDWLAKLYPFVFLILYTLALLVLIGRKPLWLDELWQLFGTRDVSFGGMLRYARDGAGGALFPHFLQWFVLKIGFSRALARVPAFAFGIATSVCFWFVARHLKLRGALLATIIFALMPIQVRYALEARPYSQALFFSCWASLLLLQNQAVPSIGKSVVLALAVTAGLYSQPFMLFQIAMLAFLLSITSEDVRRKWPFLLGPIAAAFILYLPWYLSASRHWGNGVPLPENSVFDAKLPLRVLREYTGGGYLVGLSLLALIAVACTRLREVRLKYVLLITFIAGLVLPLIAEQRLHYFYAARHLVFALPPGVLLAGTVLNFPWPTHRLWPNFFALSCAAGSLGAIVLQFRQPAQDWDLAARVLRKFADNGQCIASSRADAMAYYEFFEPSLHQAICQTTETRPIVLAVDPYSPDQFINSAKAKIERTGYRATRVHQVNRFQFIEFVR